MRILIIGGTGFIGSALAAECERSGHQVMVAGRRVTPIRALPPRTTYHSIDLTNRLQLKNLVSDCDVVAHLASSTVPATAQSSPARDIELNLLGSISILEAMVASNCRRFVFLSSGGAVYGQGIGLPFKETDALHPIGSYGIVKTAIESYIKSYSSAHDIHSLIVRPANPYGPMQVGSSSHGFIPVCLQRIVSGESLNIWGDGSLVKDFIFIDDLVSFCVMAINGQAEGIYNVGSGFGTSLNEVIRVIEGVVGRQLAKSYNEGRKFDVQFSVLDISKAIADLGWIPRVNLDEGILRTWEWYKQQKNC